jgi:hypothetical protein
MLIVHRLFLGGSLLSLLFVGCSESELVEPTLDGTTTSASGAAPKPPSNIKAVASSATDIAVSWQDNSTNESGFELHRSTTDANGAFQLLVSTGPGITSYGNGALLPSTQYCYEVRAFRTTGKNQNYSAFSSAVCARTSAAPVPATPSQVKAVPRFAGYQTDVSWTDNSTDEIKFRVERSPTGAEPWSVVGSTGAGIATLTDQTSLVGDVPACYRVFAVNSFRDSEPSSVACAVVPKAPSDLAATVLADAVTLRWKDISIVEDSYEVLRGAGSGAGLTVVATLAANSTSYEDPGLPENNYGYLVRAKKDGVESQNSNFFQLVIATTPPAPPTNLDAVPQSSSYVSVGWQNISVNAESLRVERSVDGGSSWIPVYRVDWYYAPYGFWDYSELGEQELCYRTIAFNRVGESPPSNTDCTTPPTAPTDFTAIDAAAGAVDFSWTDNSGVEDGYAIILYDRYSGYSEIAATAGPNTTSLHTEGLTFWYFTDVYVAAMKDAGFSDWSNPTWPVPPGTTSSLRLRAKPRVLTPPPLPSRVPALPGGKP